jgi:integrase
MTAKQRPHRPHELGPRLFRRGRWWAADLRPWGGERVTLRDPRAQGWPDRGERTVEREIADRWRWQYVDLLEDSAKRKQLGRRSRPKPIEQTVDEFLRQRELTVEPLTARNDSAAIRTHFLPEFGARGVLDDVDVDALQQLFDRLLRAGYAPSTLTRYLNTFGALFRWRGFTDDENPAHHVNVPDIIDSDVRAFTDEELETLRDAANEIDRVGWKTKGARLKPCSIRLAIELGLATGGRQAELFALEWTAFREYDKTVRFTAQVRVDGTGVKHLKGKRSRTTLVLPSWWSHHLRGGRGVVLDVGRVDGGVLHATRRWLGYVYERAGLVAPWVSWHTLRHTYARLFVEMGGRLEELQRSLGHESIVTTERSYGHFSEDAAATLARRRIYGAESPQSRPVQISR